MSKDEGSLELQRQLLESYEKGLRFSEKHLGNLFFANAGGATAVLAYMGASKTIGWALLPLFLFAIGTLAVLHSTKLTSNFFFDANKMISKRLSEYNLSVDMQALLEKYPIDDKVGETIMMYDKISHRCFFAGVMGGFFLLFSPVFAALSASIKLIVG